MRMAGILRRGGPRVFLEVGPPEATFLAAVRRDVLHVLLERAVTPEHVAVVVAPEDGVLLGRVGVEVEELEHLPLGGTTPRLRRGRAVAEGDELAVAVHDRAAAVAVARHGEVEYDI